MLRLQAYVLFTVDLYKVTKPLLQIMEIREAVEDASGSQELNQIQSQVLLGHLFRLLSLLFFFFIHTQIRVGDWRSKLHLKN